jgi:trimeric autotransporter adhesin
MSVSNIGSFLQSAAASWGSSQDSAIDELGSAISQAEANQSKGLAAIANGEALTRTNSQITQLIQNVLDGTTGTSGTSSSSSTGNYTPAQAATGTGKVSVSVGTTLSSLGILKGGTIYVSAGGNTTTYTSTGSDTVGDLLSAINTTLPDTAQVKATLNSRGDIVLTSKNTTDQVIVSGVYASNIGFAVGNQTFKPTAASGTPPSTTSSQTSSTSSSSKKSSTTVESASTYSSSSAASILGASGASGSLVDLLT